MDYKYFKNPEKFTGFLDEFTACSICNQLKSCYDAEVFYGSYEIKAICSECLITGKLYERNVYTCNGNIKELKKQLKDLHQNWSDVEIETAAINLTNNLEKTTPPLITWQDWDWPCADGDYCKFIGYGSKTMYLRLAKNEAAKLLFEKSLNYGHFDSNSFDINFLWDSLPESEILDYEGSNYDSLFYVFQSLNSDKIITIWDDL